MAYKPVGFEEIENSIGEDGPEIEEDQKPQFNSMENLTSDFQEFKIATTTESD
jgi:hypothetical protein